MGNTAHRIANFALISMSVQDMRETMQRMRIRLSNKLYIEDAPKWLIDWCFYNLIVKNPDFYKKERMGKWTGNTPREIVLYEKNGNTLILPFGIWSKNFYNQVKAETESITSNITAFKPINYQSSINLYGYQERAVKEALNARNGIIVMPCGAGKTQTALELIARLGMQTLWLTHTQDLLTQSMNRAKTCLDVDPKTYGTITAGKVDIGTGITFATVQTMCKIDLEEQKDTWDVVVVDECMPGDTLIDTPNGKEKLKNLRIDDIITSYDRTTGKIENKRILNVFKNKAHHIVRIKLSDGGEIVCTSNHPILARGKSWVDAERLVQNDYVLRLVWKAGRDGQHAENEQAQNFAKRLLLLLKRMRCQRRTQKDCLDGREKTKIFTENEPNESQTSRCYSQEDDRTKSYEKCRDERKSVQKAQRDRTSSENKMWEWARFNSSTTDSHARTRKEPRGICGISYSDKATERFWVSDLLQSGYCDSIRDDSDRGRRLITLCNRETRTGQEKGYILKWVRVESVEIQKQTSDGTYAGLCADGFVYNIEVEDNNNYFADGILVHNCHKAIGSPTKVMQFYKVVSALSCRYKFGLTATPKRSDGLDVSMRALLGKVIIEIPKSAVKDTTCPVKVKQIRTEYTPDYDIILNGDGTINFSSLIDNITHDEPRFESVVGVIKGLKSCLVLANRVEYLERLTRAYTSAGGKAVCLSTLGNSKSAKQIRKKALADLNAGELDCIFATYQLAAEGLDVPTLKNLVLATPEKDERIVTQSVGRVGRKAEGKEFGMVYDLCDNFSMFENWKRKRLVIYKCLGYNIE